jgi:hypothetical protein
VSRDFSGGLAPQRLVRDEHDGREEEPAVEGDLAAALLETGHAGKPMDLAAALLHEAEKAKGPRPRGLGERAGVGQRLESASRVGEIHVPGLARAERPGSEAPASERGRLRVEALGLRELHRPEPRGHPRDQGITRGDDLQRADGVRGRVHRILEDVLVVVPERAAIVDLRPDEGDRPVERVLRDVAQIRRQRRDRVEDEGSVGLTGAQHPVLGTAPRPVRLLLREEVANGASREERRRRSANRVQVRSTETGRLAAGAARSARPGQRVAAAREHDERGGNDDRQEGLHGHFTASFAVSRRSCASRSAASVSTTAAVQNTGLVMQ